MWVGIKKKAYRNGLFSCAQHSLASLEGTVRPQGAAIARSSIPCWSPGTGLVGAAWTLQ